jgi:hypothetical protein
MRVSGFITYWLLLSSLIVVWDAGFVLTRPHSMPGGKWAHIWKPSELYITIDKMYGNMEDKFVFTQSCFNVLEIIINLTAFCLLITKRTRLGALIALCGLCFTFWKTCIYFVYGYEDSTHNPWF